MGCSTLHIKTEVECHVFLFDEEKGIAKPGSYFNLEVRKGEQDLLFVSTNDETLRCQMIYNVEENDCDYRIVLENSQFKQFSQDFLEQMQLAEQGFAPAQYNVGYYYEYGQGIEQNYQKAVAWYTEAAEQGLASAQYILGCLYEHGKGVEQDFQKAVAWYTEAAKQGDRISQFHLAKCYEHGQIVEKNYQKAVEWYRKSGENYYADNIEKEYVKKTNLPYYLFFDTETTGVPMDYDLSARFTRNWPRLVQLAWIITDEDGNTLKEGNEIIRPDGFDIPADAVNVHGITTEKAMRVGKPLQDVIRDFLHEAEQAQCLVGHNISYDQRVVSAELYRLGLTDILSDKECICTMKSTTNFCKIPGYYGYKYPKLQELYRKLFDSDFEDAHDAMADITATKKCFFELLRIGKINEDPDESIDDDEQESNNEDHYLNGPLSFDDLPF